VPTLSDMVQEVSSHLRAWTAEQENMASLASPLAAGTFSITVDDPAFLSEGLYEVEEELIRITTGGSAGTATIPTWGRGQEGTAIVDHAAGAQVTRAPVVPKARVKRTINEVVAALYPSLFAVKTDESNVSTSITMTYSLPSDVVDVLDVRWLLPGGFKYWEEINLWRLDRKADPSLWPTGVTIDLGAAMTPGQKIKVVYSAVPGAMVNDTDDFATTTGIQDSASDVVCLYAASRLATGSELARLNPSSVEQSQRTQLVQPTAAINASKYLMQMADIRLQQERDKLFALYPLKVRANW
jgi:hypothetical protein